jgi:hypothetical protein
LFLDGLLQLFFSRLPSGRLAGMADGGEGGASMKTCANSRRLLPKKFIGFLGGVREGFEFYEFRGFSERNA